MISFYKTENNKMVQLDERSGQHQGNVVGAAFSQTFSGGVGVVVVRLDVFLDPGTGGFADAALAGDGTGNRGFGYAQFSGDVVDSQILIYFHIARPLSLEKQ